MRSTRGQAAVELVAILPVLALIGLLCWQAVIAGQAVWMAAAAARAAARASALDRDAATAARRALPPGLAAGVEVDDDGDGDVIVHLAIPAVIGGVHLASVSERARFAAQGG